MTDERLAIIERTISTTAPTWMDVACAELIAEVKRLREWERAVTDALVVAGIYQAKHDADPRQAIHELCCWEQAVALNPLVSSDARKLVDAEKRLREAMESALDQLEDAGIRHGAADTIRDALAE